MESIKKKQSSVKHKAPPPIRQTRTSAYRILKANPLMMFDKDTVAKMGIQDPDKIPKSVDMLGISKHKETIKLVDYASNEISKKPKVLSKKKVEGYIQNKTKKFEFQRSDELKKNKCNVQPIKKSTNEPIRQSISRMFREKQKFPKRRSKSAESFNSSKCFKKSVYEQAYQKLETAFSMDMLPQENLFIQSESNNVNFNSINNFISSVPNTYLPDNGSPISHKGHTHVKGSTSFENLCNNESKMKTYEFCNTEGKNAKKELDINMSPINKLQPQFKTPTAYNRRSVTHCTPSARRKSFYKLHCSTPAPHDLQKRLNEWLEKRGKSLGSFHHLKCFGLSRNNVEPLQEHKENDKNKNNTKTKSSENNKPLKSNDNGNDANTNPNGEAHLNFAYIAKDALDDLHKLIQDGYPIDQCEAWLGRIRQKYRELEEEPLYWECRAAIEQWKGNISSAVEHYRKAIVQGAEVQTIEESLDHLLQKFSLLKINPDFKAEDTTKKINLDVRNAFKSTIIQFAVQERMLKKKEDAMNKVIVTPVRRSTRLSVKHAGSSHIKVCASLKEIEMNENTKFQSNSYLSIRFSP